ncbi:hypothetical protein OEA_11580 [Priestia megaterium NCT-2]|nr:hypothetical protein OEA_11580 [Priestia megaterium NCT-2]
MVTHSSIPLISFLSQAIKQSIPFSSCKKQINSQTDVKKPFIMRLQEWRDVLCARQMKEFR